jgi:ribosomal protein S18 acetylase RimI-like enzyme
VSVGEFPDGYLARPATTADLDAIVELARVRDLAITGDPEPGVREYLTWIWGQPFVDMVSDTVLVQEPRGGIVAYAHAKWDPAKGGPIDGDGLVHPDHLGHGIGAALLTFMEAGRRPGASDGVRVAVPAADRSAHELLAAHGYVQVRRSFDMVRDLQPGLAPLDPPPGVEIRTFEPGRDEQTLFDVSEGAFADHWNYLPEPFESFAADFYEAADWDPSLAFLAEVDGHAAGELVAIEFETSGYVASLGVLRPFRRRGIATALLRHAFSALAARGHREVGLSVDATSPTGAVGVYEGVGMSVRREYHVFDGAGR